MIRSLAFWSGLGAASMACASPAQGAPAVQTSPAPISDAEADEFVELLSGSPLEPDLSAMSADTWKVWADHLKRDNPGRDAEVDQLFAQFGRCTSPGLRAATQAMMRRTVREMGRERVNKITAFLRKDQARMRELATRLRGSATLSAEEAAELQQLSTTYGSGLFDLPQARPNAAEQQALNAATESCLEAHVAELDRRGLVEASPRGSAR